MGPIWLEYSNPELDIRDVAGIAADAGTRADESDHFNNILTSHPISRREQSIEAIRADHDAVGVGNSVQCG